MLGMLIISVFALDYVRIYIIAYMEKVVKNLAFQTFHTLFPLLLYTLDNTYWVDPLYLKGVRER